MSCAGHTTLSPGTLLASDGIAMLFQSMCGKGLGTNEKLEIVRASVCLADC